MPRRVEARTHTDGYFSLFSFYVLRHRKFFIHAVRYFDNLVLDLITSKLLLIGYIRPAPSEIGDISLRLRVILFRRYIFRIFLGDMVASWLLRTQAWDPALDHLRGATREVLVYWFMYRMLFSGLSLYIRQEPIDPMFRLEFIFVLARAHKLSLSLSWRHLLNFWVEPSYDSIVDRARKVFLLIHIVTPLLRRLLEARSLILSNLLMLLILRWLVMGH
jgi:hypothetical protein